MCKIYRANILMFVLAFIIMLEPISLTAEDIVYKSCFITMSVIKDSCTVEDLSTMEHKVIGGTGEVNGEEGVMLNKDNIARLYKNGHEMGVLSLVKISWGCSASHVDSKEGYLFTLSVYELFSGLNVSISDQDGNNKDNKGFMILAVTPGVWVMKMSNIFLGTHAIHAKNGDYAGHLDVSDDGKYHYLHALFIENPFATFCPIGVKNKCRAVVTYIEGDVTANFDARRMNDASSGSAQDKTASKSVDIGDKYVSGAELETGDNGEVEITFQDHSAVRLGPNSKFKLEGDLCKELSTEGEIRRYISHLSVGSIWAKVSTAIGGEAKFEAHTAEAAGPRGTMFEIERTKDECTYRLYPEAKRSELEIYSINNPNNKRILTLEANQDYGLEFTTRNGVFSDSKKFPYPHKELWWQLDSKPNYPGKRSDGKNALEVYDGYKGKKVMIQESDKEIQDILKIKNFQIPKNLNIPKEESTEEPEEEEEKETK